MSYPPTPDPFSQPSPRRSSQFARQESLPSTSLASESNRNIVNLLPSAPEVTPNSRQLFTSSADHYGTLPVEDEADIGEQDPFSRLPSTPERATGPSSRTGEHDSMLVAPGSPLRHPLSPPPAFADHDGFLLVGQEELRGEPAHFDPYSRYSSANLSFAASSTADLSSSDDGDSQRVLHRAENGRRGSTLAYPVQVEYPEKEEQPHKNERFPSGAASGFWAKLSSRARRLLILALIVAAVIIAIAVGTAVSLSSRRSATVNSSIAGETGDGGVDGTTGPSTPTASVPAPSGVPDGKAPVNWRTAAVGGNGSTVYTSDGSSFLYNNSFGGFWNAIPFNDSARAQAFSPALNQKWNYGKDQIFGVNLGGWLVIEPFIVPALFEPFSSGNGGPGTPSTVVDEWTLSAALGPNLQSVIENHYRTFITEKDFAEIAAAGLNWVRIPVGFWILETYPGEPFLEGVGWKYFLQALVWARKYGLRVNLDFHSVPGSQNGYNHSSKQGTINFLNGVMGLANADRTLNYIRTFTQFISQPQYENLVPMFSIMNEPIANVIGVDNLRRFYLEVYKSMREISGFGEGKGPFITFHDGFVPYATPVSAGGWNGWLAGSDRIAIDSHPYLCFNEPSADGLAFAASKPCSFWAADFNATRQQFGFFVGGEWSLAVNDCGKWINNVGNGQRYNGTYTMPGQTTPQYAGIGSCEMWDDWGSWNSSIKAGFKMVAEANMDAMRDWFFWTWKTGFSPQMGKVINPMWNYQLGLQQGYMPADPRAANGVCASIVVEQGVTMANNPAPIPSSWQTGGAGAGQIDAAQLTLWGGYPVPTIGTAAGLMPTAFLPTYTPTQAPITAPPGPSPTSFPAGYSTKLVMGNGWAQPSASALYATPVAACVYPNPWSGAGAPLPTARC